MKILHIGKYYYPYSGGMESVVRDLCEGQVESGHEVEVLCSNDHNKNSEEEINGVRVHRLGRLAVLFGQCLTLGIFYHLKKKSRKYDLIHVHSPNPLIELAVLFLPASLPVVVTYHSDVVRQKRLLKLYRPILMAFLRRCQKIYVATENHIKYSEFLPSFKDKCEIIPFGVRESSWKRSDEIQEKVDELKGLYGDYILFVGRIVGYKGVDQLIEAAKGLDYPVVIVGDGPEKEYLEAQARELGLDQQVKFLGKVMDEVTFKALFHACHCFVLPSISRNENFGVVQLEAMACNKPVVSTDLESGVPTVVKHGETGLIVTPKKPEQLCNALIMIMANAELRKRMGRNAKKRFLEFYTFESMITQHLESYKKTLSLHEIVQKYDTKSSA